VFINDTVVLRNEQGTSFIFLNIMRSYVL